MSQRYVECKKGWVVSRDANGNYVPFFVNVRSKDIVPTDNETSPLIIALRKIGSDGRIIGSNQVYNFNVQNWNTSVFNEEEINYKRKIRVGMDGEVKLNSSTDLVITLTFPLPVVDDELLDVQINRSVFNAQLAYASTNTEFLFDTNKNIYGVKIHFYNLSYTFPSNFKNITTFLNSYVYVSVTGRYTEPDSTKYKFFDVGALEYFYAFDKDTTADENPHPTVVSGNTYYDVQRHVFTEMDLPASPTDEEVFDVFYDVVNNRAFRNVNDARPWSPNGNMFDLVNDHTYFDYRHSLEVSDNQETVPDDTIFNLFNNRVYENQSLDVEDDNNSIKDISFDLKTNKTYYDPSEI